MMRIHWSDQRGSALAGVVLSITAFFALTAVAVDIGRIAFVANEVQNAADIAATSGAMALVQNPPGDATTDAMAAVSPPTLNLINGTRADQAAQWTIEEGTFSNGTFTVQNPPSAVRATAVSTVQNIVAGVFGSSNLNTTITKQAIAAFKTISEGQPGTLPLALGECKFGNDSNCTEGNCPTMTRAPSTTDNSAFTGFFSGHATGDMRSFIPTACGGGLTPPFLHVGDEIDLTNGESTSVMQAIKCMVCDLDPPLREFLVPVVTCDDFNGMTAVTGFATIVIDSLTWSSGPDSLCDGQGAPQSFNAHSIQNTGEPGGTGGCTTCGTGTIKLVS